MIQFIHHSVSIDLTLNFSPENNHHISYLSRDTLEIEQLHVHMALFMAKVQHYTNRILNVV